MSSTAILNWNPKENHVLVKGMDFVNLFQENRHLRRLSLNYSTPILNIDGNWWFYSISGAGEPFELCSNIGLQVSQ